MTLGTYFVTSVVGMLFVGAVLYVIDKYGTVPAKRFFWGIGHPRGAKFPGEKETGFIYGRLATSRVLVAIVLSLVKLFVAIFVWMYNPVGALFIAVTDTIFMAIGTYFGGFLDRVLGGTREALTQFEERIEKPVLRGDTTVGEVTKDVVRDVASRARDAIRGDRDATTAAPTPPAQTTTQQPPPAPPTPPAPEPEKPKGTKDDFDRFVRGRKH